MKNIVFVEVKSELGAGTRGASLGVDAIKIAALDKGSRLFGKYSSIEVEVENEQLLEEVEHFHAKKIDGVSMVIFRVCKALKLVVEKKQFPIVLAGDHSTAAGTISGLKAANPDKKLGVIWIDAHADMHSPYTTPSGNMHGMPLAIVLGEDNLAFKHNDPKENSKLLWEELKNLEGIQPKIRYEDLVFIGLRDTEEEENALIKKNQVKVVRVDELREKGVELIVKDVLMYLRACDFFYISFDVDSLDADISVGTGTPVEGGINEKEANNLIMKLLESEKALCLEIVEVNPTLDSENKMAEVAFDILENAVNVLNKD